MLVIDSVWQKSKKITGLYEGGYPVGNFDGCYLSMGIIQFNLGTGSLQPILKKVFSEYPKLVADLQLMDFKNALDKGTEKDFALKVLNGGVNKLVEPWKTRLNKLNNSNEFQNIADEHVLSYKNKAIKLCQYYGLYEDRSFALMFDIAVENGGIKHYPDVSKLSYIDKLKTITNAVADQCKPKWHDDVYNRKMGIVLGKSVNGRGWDNSVAFDDKNAFNPLRMSIADFKTYVANKKAYSAASTQDKTRLSDENGDLRMKYDIQKDDYSYEELAKYL